MAETVHLHLTANGKKIIGESTQHSLNRAKTIECFSFSHAMSAPVSDMDGSSIGRRRVGPVTIQKRVDASTPLLVKALTENQVIAATFSFYRPCPSGDGQTEQFYTLELFEGRIQAIQQSSSAAHTVAGAHTPAMEEICFAAKSMIWTFVPNGISHHDSWGKNR